MKAIVIVYYKIVKKTIDILYNETIWVIWEFFGKKTPILVFSEPFVKLLATVKHNFRLCLSPESGYNYSL
jgi:hypothetical protein